MSKALALTSRPKASTAEKNIETPPKSEWSEWLVKNRGRGREVWYLRHTMKPSLTLFQVCNDKGGSFCPVGGIMSWNKRDALAELREMRTLDPTVYLARIVYSRCPEQKKGR